jgi:hypothetical protein
VSLLVPGEATAEATQRVRYCLSHFLATLWSNDLEPRKVRAVASGIAGEQDQAGDCRVCADVEIGQRRSTSAAPLPIPDEAFPGEEGRFPR